MSENQHENNSKKSAWTGFGKAIVLVIIAVLALSLFGGVVHFLIRFIVTAVVVLVIGALIFGLFRGHKQ